MNDQTNDQTPVLVERDGPVTIVSINRPERRNAVDGRTARLLFDAFLAFDADDSSSAAVFTGTNNAFCAGADLKMVATGDPEKKRELGGHQTIAPMGPQPLATEQTGDRRGRRPRGRWRHGTGAVGGHACGRRCSASSAAASACR